MCVTADDEVGLGAASIGAATASAVASVSPSSSPLGAHGEEDTADAVGVEFDALGPSSRRVRSSGVSRSRHQMAGAASFPPAACSRRSAHEVRRSLLDAVQSLAELWSERRIAAGDDCVHALDLDLLGCASKAREGSMDVVERRDPHGRTLPRSFALRFE